MPNKSQTEIQKQILELSDEIEATKDPETIRKLSKRIVDLESNLQKLKSKLK
ncbi:hypothetical protein [Cecembia rubra]|uniref:Uncharacterized protein n=1 Tax=Cecembia rubra TaxID=1485585 RepID=A0A2P8EAS8_9BACT|nr:hypothetical protein [Cecembia rubra]PSL06566.1 hypothetical protein CLV48_102383 [Cecembia rubra]